MTEAPQFRVFLNDEYLPLSKQLRLPNGILCKDFFSLNPDDDCTENFVFLCEFNSLTTEQKLLIYRVFGLKNSPQEKDESLWVPLIPWHAVKTVTDCYGNTPSLKLMRQAWILSNHVSRLDDLEIKLNGEVGHVVLMGLQQALFIDSSSGPSLNPMLFELSIHLIKQLSQGNEILKEYFTTGFPCEYMNQAKAALFPK